MNDYYNSYKRNEEAVFEQRDDVLGVIAVNPITSLDYGDYAYEWEMGAGRNGTDQEKDYSKKLAAYYAKYINGTYKYTNDKGKTSNLYFSESEDGRYQNGSYYEYVKSYIDDSFINFISAEDSFPIKAEGNQYQNCSDYLDNYINSDNETLVTYDFNNLTNKCENISGFSSIEGFAKKFRKPSRTLAAYDKEDKSSIENLLFNTGDGNPRHFDQYWGDLLGQSKTFSNDLKEEDDIEVKLSERLSLWSPSRYINSDSDYYEYYWNAVYWNIIKEVYDTESPICSDINLLLGLYDFMQVGYVYVANYQLAWGDSESTDSNSNSVDQFKIVGWIEKAVKNAKPKKL